MTDAYTSAELSADQFVVMMMLSVSPQHVPAELRTIESVVENYRHAFEPFAPFKDQQWRRKIREAVMSLERAGLIRNDGQDRYTLNDHGFSVLESADFTHADRRRLAAWMASALRQQSDNLSLAQRVPKTCGADGCRGFVDALSAQARQCLLSFRCVSVEPLPDNQRRTSPLHVPASEYVPSAADARAENEALRRRVQILRATVRRQSSVIIQLTAQVHRAERQR